MLLEKPVEYSATSMDHRMHDEGDIESSDESGWKHWGLMLLCCLPMIAIAVMLIAGIWR